MGILKKLMGGNIYINLLSDDKNKGEIIKYKEAWNKIYDLIELKNNESGVYDNKYVEIWFNSDDNLRLKKELEIHGVVIIIMSAFLW